MTVLKTSMRNFFAHKGRMALSAVAVLLSVVSSSLALLNVSVYWQDIIRGSILLTAVLFDHYLVKRRR